MLCEICNKEFDCGNCRVKNPICKMMPTCFCTPCADGITAKINE